MRRAKVGSVDGEDPRVCTLYGVEPRVARSMVEIQGYAPSLYRRYFAAAVLFAALLPCVVRYV